MSQWTQLAREGLWSNNPALVQLLGLCPLLAVSATRAQRATTLQSGTPTARLGCPLKCPIAAAAIRNGVAHRAMNACMDNELP